ncbi:MAG: 6-carboxytetrahydropterin synthase [Candidatus Competibacteraceae bacterium]|nr:6-carboxytetrahydropterin synthase [Candidatus Competibacteraceae bacterium]
MSDFGQQRWKIHIRKDNLKFSAAHMTVFPDGSKEGLHGHNYQVELEVELAGEPALARMLSYQSFKRALHSVCKAWDEKVLVAGTNPWLEFLSGGEDECAFRLCGKRYVLPAEEVAVLEVDNITAENLARVFFDRFWEKLTRDQSIPWRERIAAASLRIEESRGQGATYSVCFSR